MAFDDATRGRLQTFVTQARAALTEDFTKQFQQDYGLDPHSGTVSPLESLGHLDDQRLETARVLREILDHYLPATLSEGAEARKSALDRMVREQAFTTLNRLAALRMMEARGLVRECVGKAYQSQAFQLYQRVAGAALGETGEAYRVFLLSLCDLYGADLPVLFDRFFPNGRLFPREPALLPLLALINAAEIAPLWGEDETIGWIYQYFNSKDERKAMREASQAPRNSRELAVRNQFFTPRYVVEFLVDNTLGRLWFNWTGGRTGLRDRCRYLLVKPDEQPEAAPRLRDPRTIKLLDPACGSMHFGLYAFDLFLEIYREAWAWEQEHGPGALDTETGGGADWKPLSLTYSDEAAFLRDVPRLIVERNIFGVDIDPRAAQIASLALWLRAQRAWHEAGVRAQDRPAIGRGNVVAAVAPPAEVELRQRFMEDLYPLDAELFEQTLFLLKGLPELGVLMQVEKELPRLVKEVFGEHGEMFAKEDERQWRKAEARLQEALADFAHAARASYQGRLFVEDALQGLRIIDTCRDVFDVVVMNPPFGAAISSTKNYLNSEYPASKNDMLAVFVDRGLRLIRKSGFLGTITSRTCFFVNSFSDWRKDIIISNSNLNCMIDLGQGVMDDAMVEAAAYVIAPTTSKSPSMFVRVIDSYNKIAAMGQAIRKWRDGLLSNIVFILHVDQFDILTDSPFVYWTDINTLKKFSNLPMFEPTAAQVRKGLRTGDNFRFVRALWEISPQRFTPDANPSTLKLDSATTCWVPLVMSGSSQPWYSPIVLALNWENNGRELRQYVTKYGSPSRLIQAENYYFLPGMSWTRRAPRFVPYPIPRGCIPTGSRPMAFPNEGQEFDALAVSASRVASAFMRFYGDWFTRPNFLEGKLKLVPWPTLTGELRETLKEIVISEFSARKNAYQFHEPFQDFTLPLLLAPKAEQDSISINWATLLGDSVEHDVEEAYGILRSEAEALYSDLDQAITERSRGEETDHSDDSEDDDEGDEAVLDMSERSAYAGMISYCIGCAFGRWDINFALGNRKIQASENPFDPISRVPLGMLCEGIDFNEGRNSTLCSLYSNQANYPLTISKDGILADEFSDSRGIEMMVWSVLNILSTSQKLDIQKFVDEALLILKCNSIAEYIRRPSGFFADHLARYSLSKRKAPIYWPLSTASGSYTFWLYYPGVTSQTLYTAVNNFVEPKLRQAAQEAAALRAKGARSRDDDKKLEALQDLEAELSDFRDTLLQIAPGYRPNHDDGVQITAAPLWPLFRHKPWQKLLKETWAKLQKGDYDWSHLALAYWPERVREKCKTDKSLAIAHNLEDLYVEPEPKPAKKRRGSK